MENNFQPTPGPTPTEPTQEPTQVPVQEPTSTPEPQAPFTPPVQEPQQFPPTLNDKEPKKKVNPILLIIFAVVALGAIGFCVYTFLLQPKPTQPVPTTPTTPETPEEPDTPVEPTTDEEPHVGSMIKDGEWNVVFPGYTFNEETYPNKEFSFSVPETVTDIQAEIVDEEADGRFTYKILEIAAGDEIYNAKTICGYEEDASYIYLGGVVRQLTSAEPLGINGVSIQATNRIEEGEQYSVYTWSGMEDVAAGCQLNEEKWNTAKALVDKLFSFDQTNVEPTAE